MLSWWIGGLGKQIANSYNPRLTAAQGYVAGKAALTAIFLSGLLTNMRHPLGLARDILSKAFLVYGGTQDALSLIRERKNTQQSQQIGTINFRLLRWV